jgi:hypothetical protein
MEFDSLLQCSVKFITGPYPELGELTPTDPPYCFEIQLHITPIQGKVSSATSSPQSMSSTLREKNKVSNPH